MVRSGFFPDAPRDISTEHDGDKIKIKWNKTETNGIKFTNYKVYINTNLADDVFKKVDECDEFQADIDEKTTQCVISKHIVS